MKKASGYRVADFVRQLILAWLIAVAVQYIAVGSQLRNLQGLKGLAAMNFVLLLVVTAAITVLLMLLYRKVASGKIERWAILAVGAVLLALAVSASFTAAFFVLCGLCLVALLVYALLGWDGSKRTVDKPHKAKRIYVWVTAAMAVGFFLLVSVWTVARVHSFSTPSYDFGIFSQMFYNMKTTGLPITTLERDGFLSHFDVHMSPIYYLMLPFYCIVPRPETLQVLQAAVLASAVIPLWLIGKEHGLSGLQRTLLCAVLLAYPAFAGGTGYDIHENCFLAPLILWLLYGIDRKNMLITALAAVLTLLVKEDAAVYVGIVAVYLLVRSLLHKDKRQLITAAVMLVFALAYFFAVTGYLAENGDGVMTYRYDNFMYDDSDSLITVIKAVLMNPMKALFECVDSEKLKFIAQTMLPLLGLPLLTRRFERYILLIPYILINLMSDYQYQHDIMFQYTFGSTACLMYLAAVNVADLKLPLLRICAFAAAAAVCLGCFYAQIWPVAKRYPEYCKTYAAYYQQVRDVLDAVPENASVSATTFYTTYLSQRSVLYDIRYCSKEHLFSTDFVVLKVGSSDYSKYGGYDKLVALLESEGYTIYAEKSGTVVVYQKPSAS